MRMLSREPRIAIFGESTMRLCLNRICCAVVLVTFSAAAYVVPAQTLPVKSVTSHEAGGASARPSLPDTPAVVGTLRYGAMIASEPDTSQAGFEFPEEEKKHLARDITVFVIASAFIAAFVINVFLKGDTDTPPDNRPPGKTIP